MFYVYRFINKIGEIIYVGKTNHIPTRMYQHKTKKMPFWKEWYKIEYVEFENEGDQLLYEMLMINKYNPIYNKKDKFNAALPLEDVRKNDWKLYDEIRLLADEEISKLYSQYVDMNGLERGSYIRSFNSKIEHARDEEEKIIRKNNLERLYKLINLSSEASINSVANGLEVINTYNNGLGISCVNPKNPKSAKTLYIRNSDNEFHISGCGTITLDKNQLCDFISNIIKKYELQVS